MTRAAERKYTAAIITVSDRCASGSREDLSGPALIGELEKNGFECVRYKIVADDEEEIISEIAAAEKAGAELVLTTGGTGFGVRDVTPEATEKVVERRADGIVCAMLFNALNTTDRAMLTRGIAGIRGGSLVVNLPGSPKAATEDARYILPAVKHGINVLRGEVEDCGK